ncbi:MAG: tetratricopeptide repeat protein [Bacteroidetes bacterium]|nr:MAG: tetratricopeptide repeat protein [Bacteroidota bacterium]
MLQAKKLLFFSFLLVVLASCSGIKKSGNSKVSKNTTSQSRLPEAEQMKFDRYYFQGEKERALGHTEEAIQYYEKALEIDSLNAAAYYVLGGLYTGKGLHLIALEHFKKACAYDAENIYYFTSLAQTAAQAQKHEEAANAWEKAIGLNPGDPNLYFEKANSYIYLRKFDEALEVYNRMEKRFGVGEELVRQKEKIFLMQNKPEKAIKEVQKLIDAAPEEPRFLGMLAEIYMEIGRKAEAKSTYFGVIKLDPGNGFAYYGLAEIYRTENQKDSMLYALKNAFQDGQISPQSKINVVISLVPLIDQDPFLKKPVFELAETIAETHPDNATALSILGDLHYADGHSQIALRYYERSLELSSAELRIWRQVLSIYEENGDYKKITEVGNKAIEYFPNQLMLYYFTAAAHSQLKEWKESADLCELGIAMMIPDNRWMAALYSLMGDSYFQLDKKDKAYKAYDACLELEPNNVLVLNNYAYYLALDNKELSKAAEMSYLSLSLEPNNANNLDTYGYILFKQGKYKEAKHYIEKALTFSPNNAEVLEHLGDVLYKLDNRVGAREAWEKALKLNPESPSLKAKAAGNVNL